MATKRKLANLDFTSSINNKRQHLLLLQDQEEERNEELERNHSNELPLRLKTSVSGSSLEEVRRKALSVLARNQRVDLILSEAQRGEPNDSSASKTSQRHELELSPSLPTFLCTEDHRVFVAALLALRRSCESLNLAPEVYAGQLIGSRLKQHLMTLDGSCLTLVPLDIMRSQQLQLDIQFAAYLVSNRCFSTHALLRATAAQLPLELYVLPFLLSKIPFDLLPHLEFRGLLKTPHDESSMRTFVAVLGNFIEGICSELESPLIRSSESASCEFLGKDLSSIRQLEFASVVEAVFDLVTEGGVSTNSLFDSMLLPLVSKNEKLLSTVLAHLVSSAKTVSYPKSLFERIFDHEIVFSPEVPGAKSLSQDTVELYQNFVLLIEGSNQNYELALRFLKPFDSIPPNFKNSEKLLEVYQQRDETLQRLKFRIGTASKEFSFENFSHRSILMPSWLRLLSLVYSFPSLSTIGALEYQTWFSSTFFSEESKWVNNYEGIQLLLRSLEECVPCENLKILETQVVVLKSASTSIRQAAALFFDLVKSRLSSSSMSTEQELKEAVEFLLQVVEQFERTGLVPQTLMEASVFKAKYFHHVLLPTLLSPYHFVDSLTRINLVKELLSLDKIPRSFIKMSEELLTSASGTRKSRQQSSITSHGLDSKRNASNDLDANRSSNRGLHAISREIEAYGTRLVELTAPFVDYVKGSILDPELEMHVAKLRDLLVSCLSQQAQDPNSFSLSFSTISACHLDDEPSFCTTYEARICVKFLRAFSASFGQIFNLLVSEPSSRHPPLISKIKKVFRTLVSALSSIESLRRVLLLTMCRSSLFPFDEDGSPHIVQGVACLALFLGESPPFLAERASASQTSLLFILFTNTCLRSSKLTFFTLRWLTTFLSVSTVLSMVPLFVGRVVACLDHIVRRAQFRASCPRHPLVQVASELLSTSFAQNRITGLQLVEWIFHELSMVPAEDFFDLDERIAYLKTQLTYFALEPPGRGIERVCVTLFSALYRVLQYPSSSPVFFSNIPCFLLVLKDLLSFDPNLCNIVFPEYRRFALDCKEPSGGPVGEGRILLKLLASLPTFCVTSVLEDFNHQEVVTFCNTLWISSDYLEGAPVSSPLLLTPPDLSLEDVRFFLLFLSDRIKQKNLNLLPRFPLIECPSLFVSCVSYFQILEPQLRLTIGTRDMSILASLVQLLDHSSSCTSSTSFSSHGNIPMEKSFLSSVDFLHFVSEHPRLAAYSAYCALASPHQILSESCMIPNALGVSKRLHEALRAIQTIEHKSPWQGADESPFILHFASCLLYRLCALFDYQAPLVKFLQESLLLTHAFAFKDDLSPFALRYSLLLSLLPISATSIFKAFSPHLLLAQAVALQEDIPSFTLPVLFFSLCNFSKALWEDMCSHPWFLISVLEQHLAFLDSASSTKLSEDERAAAHAVLPTITQFLLRLLQTSKVPTRLSGVPPQLLSKLKKVDPLMFENFVQRS